jgi:hypothetical protein
VASAGTNGGADGDSGYAFALDGFAVGGPPEPDDRIGSTEVANGDDVEFASTPAAVPVPSETGTTATTGADRARSESSTATSGPTPRRPDRSLI